MLIVDVDVNLYILLFPSYRLENIMGQINIKTNNNEKMCGRTHHLLERYDSTDNYSDDYRELMICLKKTSTCIRVCKFIADNNSHINNLIITKNCLNKTIFNSIFNTKLFYPIFS